MSEENLKLLKIDTAIVYNTLNKEMEEIIKDEQNTNLYTDSDKEEMKTTNLTFKEYDINYYIDYNKIEYLKKVIKKYLKKKGQRFNSKKLEIEINAYYTPITVNVKYENERFRFIII